MLESKILFPSSGALIGLTCIFIATLLCCGSYFFWFPYQAYHSFEGIMVKEDTYMLIIYWDTSLTSFLERGKLKIGNTWYEVETIKVGKNLTNQGKEYQELKIKGNWNKEILVDQLSVTVSYLDQKKTMWDRVRHRFQKGKIK